MRSKLPLSYYQDENVVKLSRDMLGKKLCACFNGQLTSGIIVETEAYKGPEDQASHAASNRRTKRTEVMYQQGGVAYIYLIYGMHQMFNIVTGPEEVPHAILIRAIEPVEGIPTMLERRGMNEKDFRLTAGPGSLARAMGLNRSHTGTSLSSDNIWIEEGIQVPENKILTSPRVNIDYSGEWASKPWRFRLKDSPWTSKAK